MRAIFLTSLLLVLFGCAAPGYHYEVGSFTQTPNDVCWKKELQSPQAIEKINNTVGQSHGIPEKIYSFSDPNTVDYSSLSSLNIQFDSGAESIACHVVLHFVDGRVASGVLAITDPGEYAPLQIHWLDDAVIAARLAVQDRLQDAQHLYVKPNLTDIRIQRCVGAQVALGGGEQYAGQLWAACADKLGIHQTPTSMTIRPSYGPRVIPISTNMTNSDVRCDVPPYGDSVGAYKAFVKDIVPILDNPVKMLSAVCNMKFRHTDRTVMYNLGITDEEIDSKGTVDLAIEVLMGLKNFADKVPDDPQ